MKYYKVKPEADNERRADGNIYVANELYTPAEAKRYNLNMDYVDAVEGVIVSNTKPANPQGKSFIWYNTGAKR